MDNEEFKLFEIGKKFIKIHGGNGKKNVVAMHLRRCMLICELQKPFLYRKKSNYCINGENLLAIRIVLRPQRDANNHKSDGSLVTLDWLIYLVCLGDFASVTCSSSFLLSWTYTVECIMLVY